MHQIDVQLPRYGQKHLFAGFEIGFMTFAVLFLEHCRLFCVHWRYLCQDTCENIDLPILQLGLRHLQFYILNIAGYFTSIGGTLAHNMSNNIYSPALKLGLLHSLFYF